MALTRITKAIFRDENSVFAVSLMLDGEFDGHGVTIGVPAVVNRNGINNILELNLSDEEMSKFKSSCETLRQFYKDLNI